MIPLAPVGYYGSIYRMTAAYLEEKVLTSDPFFLQCNVLVSSAIASTVLYFFSGNQRACIKKINSSSFYTLM